MKAPRLFQEDARTLSPENARIARDVLRLRVGDEVQLLNGKGKVQVARVDSLTKKEVAVTVLSQRQEPKPFPELILLQGLPKGDKASEIVQRAVEWGTSKIVFVTSEHAVPKKSAAPERWGRVAIEAMRQSGNPYLPEIEGPVPLDEALRSAQADVNLLFDEEAGELFRGERAVTSVCAAVGPEGGWSPAEKETFLANGFRRVHVGPYVLRTETAAVGALAICRALYADLVL